MKICIIGKFPPIQGGVSRDTFWLSAGLARMGHEVHVVTNALQVEATYRIHSPLEKLHAFAGQQGANGGSLNCHFVTQSGGYHYIPQANPYVSAITGRAISVVRRYECDLIFGYYLEPYGVAANLSSNATGVPYGLRHAGSDVGRLMQDPDLGETYRTVFQKADFILPSATTFRRLMSLGIQREKMYPVGPGVFPTHLFRKNEKDGSDDKQLIETMESKPAFSIGLYGKIGRAKGTFDLIEALKLLKQRSINFELRILCPYQNRQSEALEKMIRRYELEDFVDIQRFKFHWEIPEFIKACSLVCFLERDFSIPIHRPLVPLEVLATSTPLVLSRDIAETSFYYERLVDGVHARVVDPKNHGALADALEELLRDPNFAQEMGENGGDLALSVLQSFDDASTTQSELFEQILSDVTERRKIMSYQDMQMVLTRLYTDRAFRLLFSENTDICTSTYALSGDEVATLKAIDSKALEAYAAGLEVKCRKIVESQLSTVLALLPEKQWKQAYRKYYDLRPARPGESMVTRTKDCVRFMSEYWAQYREDDLINLCVSELFRFYEIRMTLAAKITDADSFAYINERDSPFVDDQKFDALLLAISPRISFASFFVDVFEIEECVSEGRSLESLEQVSTVEPTSHFIFATVPAEIGVRIYPTNLPTLRLLSIIDEAGKLSLSEIVEKFGSVSEVVSDEEIRGVLKHLVTIGVLECQAETKLPHDYI